MSAKKLSDKLIKEASTIPAPTMHEAAGKVGALPAWVKSRYDILPAGG